MHLSPPGGLGSVRSKAVVRCRLLLPFGSLNCCMFLCTLFYVHSSFVIILMGKGESWLLCSVCIPGVS